MSLFFRMAPSIISASLSGMAASTISMLLTIQAAAVIKDVGADAHGMMFVSFRDTPLFVGISVFVIILCRDARSEYLQRD